MKKILIVFSIVALVTLGLTRIKAEADINSIETYASDVLSKDSGFDSEFTNSKEGWTGVAHAIVDNGSLHLSFSKDGVDAKEFPGAYQDVMVNAHTDYIISVRARKYGNVANELLYIGYRNPNADNPWTPVQEMTTNNVKAEWEEINYVINTGSLTEIRIETYTTTIVHQEGKEETGYEFDYFKLIELAKPTAVRVELGDTETSVGSKVNADIYADFNNGMTNVRVSNNDYLSQYFSNYYSVSFEIEDEKIVAADLNGNLIGVGVGTTTGKLKFSFFGNSVESDNLSFNIVASGDSEYIANVSVKLKDEVIFTDYSLLSITPITSEGRLLDLDECKVDVKVENPNVCVVTYMNNDYYVIGTGKGTSKVFATVTYNGMTNFGVITVTIESNNYLVDSGFETNDLVHAWRFNGTCGFGIDTGLLNSLSHSGYANVWLMAPCYWDANIKNDSLYQMYQDLHLEAGVYDLSGYFNRFYATGTEGTIYNVGGNIFLGATKLDENGNLTDETIETSYDTTYANSAYQRLQCLLEIEEGDYRVFVRVEGDKDYGMGMQIDDVTLIKAVYPESINAYLLEDELSVDDMSKVFVEAIYPEGVKESISSGARIISSDYSIVYESGGFLIARNPGEADITIRVTILGRKFETTLHVKVKGDAVEPDVEPTPEEPKDKGCKSAISSLSIISIGLMGVMSYIASSLKKKEEYK